MKNIIKIYRELFRCYPAMKWQIPIRAVLTILSPLIEGAIPAMAIAMILEKDIIRYVTGISMLLLIDVLARVSVNIFKNKFITCTSSCRVSEFWTEIIQKGITMDYCNLEPAAMQDKMWKGENALNGNSLGIEGLWSSSFELVCYSFGLLSYGGIILTIDIRVLLIMVAMSAAGFLLHRHAVKYSDKRLKENIQPDREFGLITWEARVPEYGKDIRIYHVENWFGRLFVKHIDRIKRWYTDTELRWYFPTVSDTAFGIIRDILMYSILISRVLHGTVTVVEFTFYVSIVSGFASWLSTFLFRVSAVMRTNLETKGYFECMDIKDVFLHGEGERLDVTAPVSIEFRDVSFRYENEEEILSHLSFKIEKGKKVALVGNNGAGKSTFIKLLCRLYDPTEGEILLNGIDIRYYDYNEYIQLFSVVFQDFKLFSFSIAENVAVSKEFDEEKVKDCLRKAGFTERLGELEKDIHTNLFKLKEDGMEISGGEAQKIAIARALYKDSPLVILDEPTSALDPVSEYEIYQSFDKLVEEKTAIYISHRMSSCRFCNQILVFDNGKIVQQGSHDELVRDEAGLYYEMWSSQAKYYQ